MTKIDYHIGPFHRGLDRVAEIALRDHVELRIVFSKVDNRLSHSAGCADQQHAQRWFHPVRSNSSSVLRIRACVGAVISHTAPRHSPATAPRSPSSAFTRLGCA